VPVTPGGAVDSKAAAIALDPGSFGAVNLTNHGTIDGLVLLEGSGAGNTVMNDGIITGPVVFGEGNDSYTGMSNAPIVVNGSFGNDTLTGGGGDDILIGGPGNDLLAGGGGADRFAFLDAPVAGNIDHITDFAHHVDHIELSHAIFATLSPSGALKPSLFVNGATALTHHQHIIYNHANGRLFYDPDGSGPQAKVLFAILDNHAALTAPDLLVIG
jgi:Ca2+-binding RTX toxin-like protein